MEMAAAWVPIAFLFVERYMNDMKKSQDAQQDQLVLDEIRKFREQNVDLIQRYDILAEEMRKKKLDTFEAISEQDKAMAAALVELARQTVALPMPPGNNVGVSGITSTGKSSMLNKLHGSNAATTGHGETTLEISSYPGTNFVLWDFPGKNDEVNYLSMKYIALWKGLTRRMILITVTVKENTSMMKLLDAIGLKYDVVVNKFDTVEDEERESFRAKIKQEIIDNNLQGVNNVFFVSAKYPNMFPDWQTMVDYLTSSTN